MALLGSSFMELGTFVDNDGATAEPNWQRPFRDQPFEARDGNNIVRHLLISGVPVFDGHSGAFNGVRGTARDITARRRAESELTRQKNMFESVFRDAPDAMAVIDAEDRIIMCNPALSRVFGRMGDQLDGISPAILYAGVDEYARHLRYISERSGIDCTDGVEPKPFLGRFRRKGGEEFSGELVASSVIGADGRTIAKVLVIRDVTERERSELALRASEARFRAVIDNAPVGIALKDREGRVLMAGRQFEVWNGLRRGEALGKAIHDLLPSEQADLLAADDRQVIVSGRGTQREFDVRLADGRNRTFLSVNFPVPGPDGEVASIGVVNTDITQRKRAERELNAAQEELIRKANFDDLTGLPNRILFLDRLTQSMLQARRDDKSLVALLFIDLDHFKLVNDTLGHAAGDHLLRLTARRLSRCVREDDTVARLGGDEFTIILPGITSGEDAVLVASKILRKLNRPYTVDGQEVFATASIGITLFPADGEDAETIVKNADAAMYNAKENGRNGYRFFTRELNGKAGRVLRLESLLRRALEQNELHLAFQPIVDARAGAVVGFEALARWHSQELGEVQPDQFISLAEDRGLIGPLGSWVLKAACIQFKELQAHSARPMFLAVNVSGRQFYGTKLIELISEALLESNLPAPSLELEITEGVLMQDLPEITATLRAITDMGIGLSIDDFGTGYSSLSYLKRFPFTSLKIDRSFVNDVTDNPDDAAFAKAIINMAHSLGLNVIGEGVEKADQLDFLMAEGCDLVQGYHFSKPMSAEQCVKFLRAGIIGTIDPSLPSATTQVEGAKSRRTAIPSNSGPAAG